MAPFFQQSVNLYAFVGPFSRCALVVGLLPLRRTSWRVAEKPWVILEVYIYNTSISGFCAAIVAQAQPFSVFCLRANIFGSVPLLVSAIGLHGKSQRAGLWWQLSIPFSWQSHIEWLRSRLDTFTGVPSPARTSFLTSRRFLCIEPVMNTLL